MELNFYVFLTSSFNILKKMNFDIINGMHIKTSTKAFESKIKHNKIELEPTK
jgi:hypothetical protein